MKMVAIYSLVSLAILAGIGWLWLRPGLPVREWSDIAAELPPAPCGEQSEHYRWREIEGMPCPMCAGINARKKEAEDRELLAEAIAIKVAAKIKTPNVEVTGNPPAQRCRSEIACRGLSG